MVEGGSEPPAVEVRAADTEGSQTGRKLGVAALVLVAAVLASRVLGFVRDAYIAYAFGANGATDAFYAAFTIPDILNYLVAGGTLSITFIPIYTRHLSSGSSDEGDRVFSTIATLMTVVLTIGIIVLWILTPTIATHYLRKLKPNDLTLAIELTRILLPAQLAFYLGGLASATLMARHRFVAAAYAPLVYNLGTILGGVVLGGKLGTASLAWGALLGAVLGPLVIQLIAAQRAGLRYRPTLQLGHPDVKSWLWLSLPLMIGVSLVTADEWILRYFAAGTEGAISRLSYARKLVWVPIAVAGQAVGQASMPFFARLFAEGRKQELGKLVLQAARGSAVIAGLCAGALAAVAVPTVDLLFHRGQFGAAEVVPTALYVVLFAAAIPLWSLQGILARAFYSAGDTLTPMISGTVVTLVSLPAYAILHRLFGPAGLALASDTGIFLHTLSLLLLLPRRLPELDRGQLVSAVSRGLLVAALAAAPAFVVARYLPVGRVIFGHALDFARIMTGGLVFAAVALVIAGPLGVTEARVLVQRVRARFRPG
jgi:putative peptidoglycan lipid II flippase